VVQQYEGNEVVDVYGVNDCFDGHGLVAEKVSSRFVAAEEVVADQLAALPPAMPTVGFPAI